MRSERFPTISTFLLMPVLSVVATLENGDTLVVGSVGREGFVESDAMPSLAPFTTNGHLSAKWVEPLGGCPILYFKVRMAKSALILQKG